MKHIKLFEQFINEARPEFHDSDAPDAYGRFKDLLEKVNLKRVEDFADDKMNPVDVTFTKHFFDRLTRMEHDKEITDAELIGFFKRLAKKKKEFEKFMNQYDEFVVKDDRTDINIPFKSKVDQIIAKTIMRKDDFKTSDAKYNI